MPNGELQTTVAPPADAAGAGPSGATRLRLRPGRILRALLLIIALLVALSLIAHLLRFGFGYSSALGFINLFDLDREGNVPTWFSSALMAACALMLGLIAAEKKSAGDRWFLHWAGLGVIFALMSVDELVQVHERFINPLQRTFDLGGLLTNAWVILAFILLPILGLIYARFLLALPRRACWLFILSGAVYIAGVVGVEMVSGLMKSSYGTDDLRFALVTTLEETLEMLGLALFAYALADYAARQKIEWRLTFRAE